MYLFAIKSQGKTSHFLEIVMGYLKEWFKNKQTCLPLPTPPKREKPMQLELIVLKKPRIVTDGFHFANNLTTV